MLGYLCLEIICSLRFEENCSLHSTDKVRRQIFEHTVLHQMVFLNQMFLYWMLYSLCKTLLL